MIRKLLVLLLCLTAATATAKKPKSSASKKAESSAEKPKESDYDKLFKEKHTVADGMFRLHDVKGKLYFEIPDSLFGREMLLGSTISEVSDNAAATTGSKSDYPLHVVFTRNDRSVQLRTVNCENITDETGASRALAEAVKRNTADPILRNYKIEAWNRDSTAVVVNVTDLFVADVEEMSPFSKYGLYTAFELKKTFQKERSMLGEIKAFSDNVVVRSTLSYIFTLTRGRTTLVKDQPLTAVMTRSLVLLPREPYRPRITDSRMSVFPTGKVLFSEREQRAKVIYYDHRWRLEPSDMDAWRRGERVAPKKQIVFYVDDGFPEMWKKHIFEAVGQWNEPFGRIGFKNAIAAKPYPKYDPESDPDNIKYSCIRYAPIAIANAMGPSWVDPRSGEILNASVYVYHDVMKLLNNWLFVQTAQADERVRAVTIPEEVIGDGLRYVVAHEVGHCLGYMHNMSASAVIPVDSLRSPSFTQKYGTTTSIMDYARFNYVARPGDRERGVKLTPPRFGLYDYYAVKWLYTPVPDAATAADEYAVTSKWITGAAADSVYRFGKQQFSRSIDPRSQSGRRRREGLGLRHRQSEIHSRQHERLDQRPGPRFLPAAHPLRRGAHAVYPLPEPRAGQRRRHLLRREDGGRPRGSLPQRAARTPARSPAVLSRAAQGHEVAGQRRTDPRHAADGFARRVDHGFAGVGRRGRPGACGFERRAGRKGGLHARGVPQGCL